jgi:hypothetical protein
MANGQISRILPAAGTSAQFASRRRVLPPECTNATTTATKTVRQTNFACALRSGRVDRIREFREDTTRGRVRPDSILVLLGRTVSSFFARLFGFLRLVV